MSKELSESSFRTDSSRYNAGTRQNQRIHEEINSVANWAPIMAAIKEGRARDLKAEPKVAPGQSALIISSGPSLDDNIEKLRGWQGGVFCSTSHATTLMHYGIEPTHICVLDPFCSWEEIAGIDWGKTKAKLIVNPSVWPDLIPNWPNEILLFRQNVGNDDFYSQLQVHMYARREPDTPHERHPKFIPLIPTDVTLFACTPPFQLFCTHILGYENSFLVGCDFGISDTKTRFTRWQPDASGVWKEEVCPLGTYQDSELIKTNRGGFATQIHLYYKKNFLSAWRLSLQNLWSVDKWTSLEEVPFLDCAEVVERQGKGYAPKPKEAVIHDTEVYLARVGAFILSSDSGLSFIETPNPLEDLPVWMANARRIWACNRCHNRGEAKDEADHSGEACPNCGNVGMSRAIPIDAEANMARIRALLAEIETKGETTSDTVAVSEEKTTNVSGVS